MVAHEILVLAVKVRALARQPFNSILVVFGKPNAGFYKYEAMNSEVCVILAAGEGTRMRSSLPKVLHEVCGRALIDVVLDNVQSAGVQHSKVIIGSGAVLIMKSCLILFFVNLVPRDMRTVTANKPDNTTAWYYNDLFSGTMSRELSRMDELIQLARRLRSQTSRMVARTCCGPSPLLIKASAPASSA